MPRLEDKKLELFYRFRKKVVIIGLDNLKLLKDNLEDKNFTWNNFILNSCFFNRQVLILH